MNKHKKYYYTITALFVTTSLILISAMIWGLQYFSDIKSSVEETRLRVSKSTEIENNLKNLKKSYEKIKPETEKIDSALPEDKDTSGLISDLDFMANQNGLKLTSIQSVSTGKKVTIAKDLSLLQTIKGKYSQEIPLEIKVSGSFSKFSGFVSSIESYRRILSISSIEINKSPDLGDNIEAIIKLTAYLKK